VTRAVVRAVFLRFTEGFEGGLPYLYDDIEGIPTIAYGNAVFTPGAAAALPLMQPGGVPATYAEKVAAWQRVHDDPNAAHLGHLYAKQLTTLRLTREGMQALALAKFDANDAALRRLLPDWEDMPGCAQLAMHSWAWACGAGAYFPHLISALKRGDYDSAVVEIHMDEWTKNAKGERINNGGLVPRNVANKILMKNAARVRSFHLDPDVIDWTHDLSVSDEPTQPELPNPPSEPTIVCEPILHVDPSTYLRPDDGSDPET
jgi:GH24 family phage-related lysozyme (muramidase)